MLSKKDKQILTKKKAKMTLNMSIVVTLKKDLMLVANK
jgi:hypothetical protein